MSPPGATVILALSLVVLPTLACAGPEKQSPDEMPSPAAAPKEPSDDPRLTVFNSTTGDYYTLPAEMDGAALRRLRAADGSLIEFSACELDLDLYGICTDKAGQEWEIEGL